MSILFISQKHAWCDLFWLIILMVLGNALFKQEAETIIPFPPSDSKPAVDEAGYAKVGSPIRKGYAFLKPAPERCRSEYQKLVKPNEGTLCVVHSTLWRD